MVPNDGMRGWEDGKIRVRVHASRGASPNFAWAKVEPPGTCEPVKQPNHKIISRPCFPLTGRRFCIQFQSRHLYFHLFNCFILSRLYYLSRSCPRPEPPFTLKRHTSQFQSNTLTTTLLATTIIPATTMPQYRIGVYQYQILITPFS